MLNHLYETHLEKSAFMKSPVKNFFVPPVLLVTAALVLSIVSGCQKAPLPETSEAVEPTIQDDSAVTEHSQTKGNAAPATEMPQPITTPVDDANPETMPLSQQPTKGTQVTDVHYRSDSGETLSVVFETSGTGTLNAIITLANDSKITLSAPEGQGNNPTYHSADGKMELVSHEGGTVIDLIRDDKMISFTAISAEAEVITQT